MKKTIKFIVVVALCLNFNLKAQEPTQPPSLKSRSILGKVISASTREALPGAVIKITNTNQTVLSNDRGEFILSLPDGSYNLSVHYLSYKAKSIVIQIPLKEAPLIELETDDKNLQEVEINAGYYTVKDRERTGSISRVTAETIGKQPVNNILLSMQGRIPGVEIIQQTGLPGGGVQVRIRGQNSISNGNDPLYIINGIPFLSTAASSSQSGLILPNASPLSLINPGDIESIEVLKDADATAIYGSRGANGVILITTKKGKSGNLNVDANISQGIGNISHKIELLNTPQFIEMRKEAFANENLSPGESDYDVNGIWDENRYTDWQKELIGGKSSTTNGQLSLSGGSANTNFLLGGSYYRETSVFPGSKSYQKKSSNLSVNHSTPDKKIKLSFFGNYNFEKNNLPTIDLTQFITLAPNAPSLLTPSGQLNWEDGLGSLIDNPMAYLFTKYNVNANTLNLNGNLSYEILPDLGIAIRGGYNRFQKNELSITPLSALSTSYDLTANDRTGEYGDNLNQVVNVEPSLSYKLNFGNHIFDFLTGATIQSTERQNQYIQGKGYVSDALIENVFSAAAIQVKSASRATYRYLSAYSRINYKYKDRYIVNLTARRDGSSRFGPENIYANFGAIGMAWIFSDEKFFKEHLGFLQFGKLRASYGTSGNDQIGDYRYLDLWQQQTNPYQSQPALVPTRLFNPKYAWEVNKKAEISLELVFLNNKISLNSSFFRNRSSNQLVQYTLAPSTGFSGVTANLPATVENTGWEFDLTSKIITNTHLKWVVNANLSIPRNKLVAFPNFQNSSYANTYVLGQSLNIVRTVESTGVNPVTGLYTFKDNDGNGQINANDKNGYRILGQRYSGGIDNSLTSGNFELSFFIQFVKQTGKNYRSSLNAPGASQNQPKVVLERWREEGDISSIQKFGINDTSTPYFYATTYSDYGISDASFARLKNVALSYKFKSSMLSALHLSNLKLFVQGQNLVTFSNYLGLDPESQGFASLPSLRVIMAGLQISL